ncbi:protein FAM216A isoform X2 [Trachinotus anak]|uniref:protein FAM216A isoform X2 n=1 Tax=Trachinotus anak TaxID=443729 RepID=UPI0039F1E2BF
MKKQVTFAESQTVHRLHHDDALPRSVETKSDAGTNFYSGVKINTSPTARTEPQLQHLTMIQIPKTMTAAPFLKHTALTPAQKEYLYTVAASCSTAHVRSVITQHYMNVLHRRIQAGYNRDRDDLVVTSPENDSEKSQSQVSSRVKHKGKRNTSARHPGKSSLPKIPNRQARPSSTSASKHRKMKKRTTTPTLRRKSPRSRSQDQAGGGGRGRRGRRTGQFPE